MKSEICENRFEKVIKGLHINLQCGDTIANEIHLCPKCKKFKPKKEEKCENCGQEEWRHPYGFVSMGKFRWICKKFIPQKDKLFSLEKLDNIVEEFSKPQNHSPQESQSVSRGKAVRKTTPVKVSEDNEPEERLHKRNLPSSGSDDDCSYCNGKGCVRCSARKLKDDDGFGWPHQVARDVLLKDESLSDKRKTDSMGNIIYFGEDIKKSVKKLKKKNEEGMMSISNDEINKIFGKELTSREKLI